ncbi:MAG: hypothetical protein JW709_07005 [Sedimentisphaerales bacterium]|nr:hypothetical protein [Sedimentisphaerales bacterium]
MKVSQALIIMLLILNLLATVYFGWCGMEFKSAAALNPEAQKALPAIITPELREQYFQQFQKAFNAADYDAIYKLFGPIARAQVSEEELAKELQKMTDWFHRVDKGTYTHSEWAGKQGLTDGYYLYYAVTFPPECQFGQKGILKISIGVEGREVQILGFFLNSV